MAGVTGLGKSVLIAVLTEYLLFLKDEGGILKCFLASIAHKVFWMPHLTHSTGKRTPVCMCEREGEKKERKGVCVCVCEI